MGLWPRLGAAAAAAAAAAWAGWRWVEAAGHGQAAAAAVAGIAAAVVVTLGAVWAARARGDADPPPPQVAGGGAAVVSASPSGMAVGEAHGTVFGPGANFAGATVTIRHAPQREPGAGRVVVGEIPQAPPAFQDRPELLAALTGEAGAGGGGVRVVFAVTGLRGVGKSQLAAACARQRVDQGWPVVAWIDASATERLLAGFAQLAAALGLAGDQPDSAQAATRVRHHLEAGGRGCLLVLDDAGDADAIRPFLPAAGHAQVIVTSSRAALAALGTPIPVGAFTPAQAAAFLAQRTGLDDQAGALALAEELGFLPLGLACAGAVIAGQRLDYPTCQNRLAALPLDAYLTRPGEDPYPRGAAQAITLALDAATANDPTGLARQLLEVIALLSPAGAPRTLLHTAARSTPARRRWPLRRDPRGTITEATADEALAHLAGWSLVTWSLDGASVAAHRLVMRAVREQAAPAALAAAAHRAIHSLRAMLPPTQDAWKHPEATAEFTIQATALADHLDPYPGLLDRQAEEDLLLLLAQAGWHLIENSDTARAIPHNERVLADCQALLGPSHPGTLTARSNLATAYQAAGRLDEAIALHQQNLADTQRVLGPDDPDTLRSRNNLAAAYRAAGQLDEAIALHEQNLADMRRLVGPDHPYTLRSRSNLATAYQAAGRLDEAIALHQQNLADRQRLLGPDHPDTLRSRNNLAGAYQDAGQLDEAIAFFKQTLADTQRVLGPDHPDTLRSRNNLAAAYLDTGRAGEAITLLEDALAGCERALGREHPVTRAVQENLRAARSAGQ